MGSLQFFRLATNSCQENPWATSLAGIIRGYPVIADLESVFSVLMFVQNVD